MDARASLCAQCACRCPKKSELSGPLKLELQAVKSYLIWVRGTEAESSAKVPNC